MEHSIIPKHFSTISVCSLRKGFLGKFYIRSLRKELSLFNWT